MIIRRPKTKITKEQCLLYQFCMVMKLSNSSIINKGATEYSRVKSMSAKAW